MSYFKVTAKCGHVGKGHYIIKDYFVKAEDGKEAAYKVRFFPRVKHDWKDAIVSVERITAEEFVKGCEIHDRDLFFYITNSSEQKAYGVVDYEQICDREEPEKRKKDKGMAFYSKMAKIRKRDLRTRLAEVG